MTLATTRTPAHHPDHPTSVDASCGGRREPAMRSLCTDGSYLVCEATARRQLAVARLKLTRSFAINRAFERIVRLKIFLESQFPDVYFSLNAIKLDESISMKATGCNPICRLPIENPCRIEQYEDNDQAKRSSVEVPVQIT